MSEIDEKVLPNHVGFILDGNRRWAKKHGLPTLKGHYQGSENLRKIANATFDAGVPNMSVYLFSTENWQRTKTEVSYLMQLIIKFLSKYLQEFIDKETKIVFVGSREGLPKSVLTAIDKSTEATKNFKGKRFAICINYGGQQEVVDATKKLLREGLDPNKLTSKVFEKYLYAPELPELDLVVRTSGEYRLSGFMLYRAAYAEIIVVDKNWPDFDIKDLRMVLNYYSDRTRRFGK